MISQVQAGVHPVRPASHNVSDASSLRFSAHPDSFTSTHARKQPSLLKMIGMPIVLAATLLLSPVVKLFPSLNTAFAQQPAAVDVKSPEFKAMDQQLTQLFKQLGNAINKPTTKALKELNLKQVIVEDEEDPTERQNLLNTIANFANGSALHSAQGQQLVKLVFQTAQLAGPNSISTLGFDGVHLFTIVKKGNSSPVIALGPLFKENDGIAAYYQDLAKTNQPIRLNIFDIQEDTEKDVIFPVLANTTSDLKQFTDKVNTLPSGDNELTQEDKVMLDLLKKELAAQEKKK